MRKFVSLLLLFIVFSSHGQNQEKIDSLEKILKVEINKDVKIDVLYKLGKHFKDNENYLKSREVFEEALELSETISDTLFYAHLNFDLGYVYDEIGENNLSMEKVLISHQLFKSINEFKYSIRSLNLLGIIQIKLKNYKDALEFCNESLELASQHKDSVGYYRAKKNMAIVFKKTKNYKKAISYNIDIAGYERRNKLYGKLGKTYNNIGSVYFKVKEYDSTLLYYQKSLVLKEKYGSKGDIVNAYIGLGNLNFRLNRPIQSESYLLKAKNLAKKHNLQHELMNSLQSIAVVKYTNGKYKDAFDAFDAFYTISDSLASVELKTNVAELQTKYQTQQKENEILKLSKENSEQEAQLAQSRLLNISGASLLLLLSGLGLFFWHRKKQQQKVALLESTVEAGEQEKKRIGKELHDGIAGSLIKLVHDTEGENIAISDKLLSTYNEVRNLSHQLDNTPMHGDVFMDRLIELIPQNKNDQVFSFKIKPNNLELQEPHGTHIYRIIQELISNNIKHANATKTKIYVQLESEILSILYEDNGVGITKLKKGNGFKNIEDRIELMNGSLTIDKLFTEGFKLEVSLPYTIN